jgi:hypothetical protein
MFFYHLQSPTCLILLRLGNAITDWSLRNGCPEGNSLGGWWGRSSPVMIRHPASTVVGCLKHQKLAWGSLIKCDNAEFMGYKLLSSGDGKFLSGALIINVGELKTR